MACLGQVLGGHDIRILAGQKVRVQTGTGYLIGVFGGISAIIGSLKVKASLSLSENPISILEPGSRTSDRYGCCYWRFRYLAFRRYRFGQQRYREASRQGL